MPYTSYRALVASLVQARSDKWLNHMVVVKKVCPPCLRFRVYGDYTVVELPCLVIVTARDTGDHASFSLNSLKGLYM